jgi:hypothetical protein
MMQYKRSQYISAGAVVLVIAIIGTVLVLSSHAATPYASINADKGSVANGATVKTCSGADDGSCVVFGSATSTPPPTTGDQPAPPELFDSTDGSTPFLTSPIPANPTLDANSSTMVSTIGSNLPTFDGSSQWQIPIYNTSNSDPSYNPSFSENWGCSVGGSMHIPSYATREVPDASAGGDAWVATVNTKWQLEC